MSVEGWENPFLPPDHQVRVFSDQERVMTKRERKRICPCLCHETGGGGIHFGERCRCNRGPGMVHNGKGPRLPLRLEVVRDDDYRGTWVQTEEEAKAMDEFWRGE